MELSDSDLIREWIESNNRNTEAQFRVVQMHGEIREAILELKAEIIKLTDNGMLGAMEDRIKSHCTARILMMTATIVGLIGLLYKLAGGQ